MKKKIIESCLIICLLALALPFFEYSFSNKQNSDLPFEYSITPTQNVS